ncbi:MULTISPECIES: hypothetical protein [unclassified Modicisalibacter]|uniref:hypothetical protein n=1 Tax=unclassified Modicisalibacter TaxID=2679913 RepID=UPI001CCE33A7|nr:MULTISPECIES: hypothetical protein [unclassified Modicisalibacter]MBZ9559032.1 hypothetical protein [Modicisalibacter sp. R2A 31.J]MBZ9576856.1 hypothetical protein [Modicisalibacter sp. MOD 31.J]
MTSCQLSVEVLFDWERASATRYLPVCYLDGQPIELRFDLVRVEQATLEAAYSARLVGEIRAGDWCVREQYLIPAIEASDFVYYSLESYLQSRDDSVPQRSLERFLDYEVRRQIGRLRHEGMAQTQDFYDIPTRASGDVLAERRRQVEVEGWEPSHDDTHRSAEMVRAAIGYANLAALQGRYGVPDTTDLSLYIPHDWPWATGWWKPSRSARRNLIKAAALLLAEIERLDRAADRDGKKGDDS